VARASIAVVVVATVLVSVGLVVVAAIFVVVRVHMGVAFAVSSVRVFVTMHVSVLEEVRVSVSVFVHVLLAGHMGFTLFSVGMIVKLISFNVGVIMVNNDSVHFVSVGTVTMVVSFVIYVSFTLFSVSICISIISFNVGVIVVNDHSVNNVSMGAGTMEVLNSMVVSIASFMRFTLFSVSISISIISFNVGVIVVNDHSVNNVSMGAGTMEVLNSMVVSVPSFVRQGCGESESHKAEKQANSQSRHFSVLSSFQL